MKRILFILLLSFCTGCIFRSFSHDADTAAISAVEFAYVGFVERNADKAYGMLAPISQEYYSREKIAMLLDEMHPGKSPLGVTADEFQQLPGNEMIVIFLKGKNGNEKFSYRLELLGNASKGYKVSGLFRDFVEVPASNFQHPLSVKRSAGKVS